MQTIINQAAADPSLAAPAGASVSAHAELRERVVEAAARHTPLTIRGGGTKDWYGNLGNADSASVLDTRGYAGILDYDPAELSLTACAGTPLAEIEAALAAHRQWLPFEPPHFGTGATLGGCIGAGLAGPRRAQAGSVRDFVLGAAVMNSRGETLHFGGKVMKNVAGYDVARVMAGSLGTLGLILNVSLKVNPLPAAERTINFEMSEPDALRALNQWGGQPLPISASAWHDDVLTVRLSGADAAVAAARQKLGGTLLDDARAVQFWDDLREQRHAYFANRAMLWRLSVPSTAAPLALGAQLIEWGGAQRWLALADAADADATTIRATVNAVGGHATLFRRYAALPATATPPGAAAVPIFTPLPAATLAIHQRLKAVFDPQRLFNPGRMFAEL